MIKQRHNLLIAMLLLLTGLSLTAQAQTGKDHNFEVAKHLDIFNQLYKNLELLYVDTLNPKETIGRGITAMLRSLDPYTEYYAQDETKNLRMMLTGKYAGIGALIRKHQKLDRIVIDEPYQNMPAAEVGLKKGDIPFMRRLNLFFERKRYNVANEPSFLTPCLYHWLGRPDLTSERVRQIITDNYNDSPTGLPGNDDSGAMSSWLVFHMMGLYPNAGQDYYLLHAPLLKAYTMQLCNGNIIHATVLVGHD